AQPTADDGPGITTRRLRQAPAELTRRRYVARFPAIRLPDVQQRDPAERRHGGLDDRLRDGSSTECLIEQPARTGEEAGLLCSRVGGLPLGAFLAQSSLRLLRADPLTDVAEHPEQLGRFGCMTGAHHHVARLGARAG